MDKIFKITLILAVVFLISIMYGGLTGEASRNWKSGYYLNNHKEREISSVEILGQSVNKDGLTVIKKGGILKFIVKPGKNGVYTGYQVENAISGLRFDGNHCSNQGTSDFCSNAYKCVDKDPNKCKMSGKTCYGDKLIEVKVPSTIRPGNYVVSICDAVDECHKCKVDVKKEFIIQ